jgi:hypothetical protein
MANISSNQINPSNIIEEIDELTNNLTNIQEQIKNSQTICVSNENLSMVNLVPEKPNRFDELNLILFFLKSNDKINNLLKKMSVSLDSKTRLEINRIIDYISTNNVKFSDEPPIKIIIGEIKKVFEDGKLDLYDIPEIINIVTQVLNINFSDIKAKSKANLNPNTLGIFIKIIIHSLIELNILKVNQEEYVNINKLIDSSIALLNTSLIISKSCGFFRCGKKIEK